jgi:ferredoxin
MHTKRGCVPKCCHYCDCCIATGGIFECGWRPQNRRARLVYNDSKEPPRDAADSGSTRRMAGKLKIHVDPDKCQGHSRCKSLAPELFELDEYGNAHEIGDGTVPDGLEDKAWLAKSNCPELAIDITED